MKSTSSENKYYCVGQSSTKHLFMGWIYNSTESNGYGTISTYGGSHNLSLQKDGGNVGVGATNPKTALEVNGGFLIHANSESWSSTVGKGLFMRYSTNGSQDTGYISSSDRYNSTNHPLLFEASKYNFKGGNVGIGTTDPTKTLEVAGDISCMPTVAGVSITSSGGGSSQWTL